MLQLISIETREPVHDRPGFWYPKETTTMRDFVVFFESFTNKQSSANIQSESGTTIIFCWKCVCRNLSFKQILACIVILHPIRMFHRQQKPFFSLHTFATQMSAVCRQFGHMSKLWKSASPGENGTVGQVMSCNTALVKARGIPSPIIKLTNCNVTLAFNMSIIENKQLDALRLVRSW